MFTENRIGLQEFTGRFGLDVRRDCQFSYIGKIPTNLNNRVVPCGSVEHIEQARIANGIAGIITHADLAENVPEEYGLAVAEHPVKSAYQLHEALVALPDFHWKSFESRISPTAQIHPSAVIAPQDVVIGAGTIVGAQAAILARSQIGNNCTVGPGTVIGNEAFEIASQFTPPRIVVQSGGVLIEENVEFAANCTVARSTFGGFTRIGAGSKLDSNIYIAHDCQLGRNIIVTSSCTINGRVRIGDNAYIGPGSKITNGINIEAQARVSLGSVVTKDVAEGATVSGNFAVPHDKWLAFVKSL